jgi:hypothetical protein
MNHYVSGVTLRFSVLNRATAFFGVVPVVRLPLRAGRG